MQSQIRKIVCIIPKGKERNPELILEQLCKTTLNPENEIIFVPLSINLFFKKVINHLGF